MKVIAINGSPRMDNGNTALILNPFLEGMKEAGADVELFFARKLNVAPCNGDMSCWFKNPGVCGQKDDMQMLLPKLADADVVVWASPVYYSGITGRVGLASYLAVLALLVEGIVVLLNKGNCPMGMIHRRVGDPKTLLELFLPPRLAKKGIPFAAFVAFIGFLLLLFRTLDTV